MEIALLVGVVAFLKKSTDFVKYVSNWNNGGQNGVITQIFVWAGGVLTSLTLFVTQIGDNITIAHTHLSQYSTMTRATIGVLVASIASAVHDWQKARDNTDSSSVPPLIHNASNAPKVA